MSLKAAEVQAFRPMDTLAGTEQVLIIIDDGFLKSGFHRLPRPSGAIFGIIRLIAFVCEDIFNRPLGFVEYLHRPAHAKKLRLCQS